MVNDCFIGLGSNLGNPETQLRFAVDQLAALSSTHILDVSPLFRTTPVGPQDQPEFLNAAVHIQTTLSAHALLAAIQEIEKAAGRTPTRHWGERMLDLDILSYGDDIIHTADLIVPHAHIGERAFVLVPLHAIAPHLVLADGRSIEALYRTCNKDGVWYHSEADWRPAP